VPLVPGAVWLVPWPWVEAVAPGTRGKTRTADMASPVLGLCKHFRASCGKVACNAVLSNNRRPGECCWRHGLGRSARYPYVLVTVYTEVPAEGSKRRKRLRSLPASA
jgi:hypothetical protein